MDIRCYLLEAVFLAIVVVAQFNQVDAETAGIHDRVTIPNVEQPNMRTAAEYYHDDYLFVGRCQYKHVGTVRARFIIINSPAGIHGFDGEKVYLNCAESHPICIYYADSFSSFDSAPINPSKIWGQTYNTDSELGANLFVRWGPTILKLSRCSVYERAGSQIGEVAMYPFDDRTSVNIIPDLTEHNVSTGLRGTNFFFNVETVTRLRSKCRTAGNVGDLCYAGQQGFGGITIKIPGFIDMSLPAVYQADKFNPDLHVHYGGNNECAKNPYGFEPVVKLEFLHLLASVDMSNCQFSLFFTGVGFSDIENFDTIAHYYDNRHEQFLALDDAINMPKIGYTLEEAKNASIPFFEDPYTSNIKFMVPPYKNLKRKFIDPDHLTILTGLKRFNAIILSISHRKRKGALEEVADDVTCFKSAIKKMIDRVKKLPENSHPEPDNITVTVMVDSEIAWLADYLDSPYGTVRPINDGGLPAFRYGRHSDPDKIMTPEKYLETQRISFLIDPSKNIPTNAYNESIYFWFERAAFNGDGFFPWYPVNDPGLCGKDAGLKKGPVLSLQKGTGATVKVKCLSPYYYTCYEKYVLLMVSRDGYVATSEMPREDEVPVTLDLEAAYFGNYEKIGCCTWDMAKAGVNYTGELFYIEELMALQREECETRSSAATNLRITRHLDTEFPVYHCEINWDNCEAAHFLEIYFPVGETGTETLEENVYARCVFSGYTPQSGDDSLGVVVNGTRMVIHRTDDPLSEHKVPFNRSDVICDFDSRTRSASVTSTIEIGNEESVACVAFMGDRVIAKTILAANIDIGFGGLENWPSRDVDLFFRDDVLRTPIPPILEVNELHDTSRQKIRGYVCRNPVEIPAISERYKDYVRRVELYVQVRGICSNKRLPKYCRSKTYLLQIRDHRNTSCIDRVTCETDESKFTYRTELTYAEVPDDFLISAYARFLKDPDGTNYKGKYDGIAEMQATIWGWCELTIGPANYSVRSEAVILAFESDLIEAYLLGEFSPISDDEDAKIKVSDKPVKWVIYSVDELNARLNIPTSRTLDILCETLRLGCVESDSDKMFCPPNFTMDLLADPIESLANFNEMNEANGGEYNYHLCVQSARCCETKLV